jgi:hypothetical protein
VTLPTLGKVVGRGESWRGSGSHPHQPKALYSSLNSRSTANGATSCLVAVLDGEAKGLKTGGMARQFEDPEHAHDPKDLDHALQVLRREVRLHIQDHILKGLFHKLTRLK